MSRPRRTYRCYLRRDDSSNACVFNRLRFRRHLTMVHHYDVVRTNRPGGYFTDKVVPSVGPHAGPTNDPCSSQEPVSSSSPSFIRTTGATWFSVEPQHNLAPAKGEGNGESSSHHYDRDGHDNIETISQCNVLVSTSYPSRDVQCHAELTGFAFGTRSRASLHKPFQASGSCFADRHESWEQSTTEPLTSNLVELDNGYADQNLSAGTVNSQQSVPEVEPKSTTIIATDSYEPITSSMGDNISFQYIPVSPTLSSPLSPSFSGFQDLPSTSSLSAASVTSLSLLTS